jgi:8-oxo-dGTP diphosphatase
MSDWQDVPVFGSPPPGLAPLVRPSAYALIIEARGRLAVVRTPSGIHLPGGGIDPGESATAAVVREVREECGLAVKVGGWAVRAVDYVHSKTHHAHYEKRCTFVDADVVGPPAAPDEVDHELLWLEPHIAVRTLAHPSHAWAVGQWQRNARVR